MLEIVLKSNRKLTYSIFGNSKSKNIVFHFHGFPSCSIEGEIFDKLALEKNLKIITVNRPGFSTSDADPNHTIAGFITEDMIELVEKEASDAEQISVLGISGGGPYVAACLYYWPTCNQLLSAKFKHAVFVAGLSPYEPEGFQTYPFKFRMASYLFSLPWILIAPLFALQAKIMYC